MKRLDLDRFSRELLQATSHSVDEVREVMGKQRVYGVSLFVDRLGASVALGAQSEEGLARTVEATMKSKSYIAKQGDLASLLNSMQRWDCSADWFYTETFFDHVNHLLLDSYGSDPDKFFDDGATRLVILSCLTTLAALDSGGVFGRKAKRHRTVLNLWMGDQSDDDLNGWAALVNPLEVYQRYAAELQSARTAYDQLEYVYQG